MIARIQVATTIALASAGCDPPTSEVTPEFHVRASAARLEAVAIFFQGSHSDVVEPGDGDKVLVTFRQQSFRLERSESGFHGPIDLDSPIVADEPIEFAVVRDGEADAPSSTLDIPPRLDIDVPLFIPRSKDFTFGWSPTPNETMYWQIYGRCGSGDGAVPVGASSFTIPAGTIKSFEDDTCTMTLTLHRSGSGGSVDPAFHGGGLYYSEDFIKEFASTP